MASLSLVMSADGWCAKAPGDKSESKQQAIKAAVILNIAKFVSWPQPPTRKDNIDVCYYQLNPQVDQTLPFHKRQLWGHTIKDREVSDWASADQCTLLVVSAENLLAFKLDVQQGPPRPVLVVADLTQESSKGMAHTGVHVALVRQGTRIGFEIHLAELEKSGLKASSELLKLARIVKGGG